MLHIQAKLFGTPSVSVNGQEINLPYKKASALLYYLLLKRKATRSELIALLYADSDASGALRNLRHAIYSIRQAFQVDPFISKQRDTVEFSSDVQIHCDIDEFERDNFSAYTGEFLRDFSLSHADAFDFWLTDQRAVFQMRYQHHLLSAQRDAYYTGELDKAEKYGLDCIAIDPLEENAYSILMQVYRDRGDFRKAIGLYHTLCKNLSDEFNITPLKETSALYYQIVDAWNRSTFRFEDNSEQSLFGKDHALHKLVSLCNISRRDNDISCLVLQGKSGVGKTHLVNYMLSQYDFSGWIICKASCYQSEIHNALAPWNTIMLELLSKLDDLNISISKFHRNTASGIFPCLSVEANSDNSDLSDVYLRNVDYLTALESTFLIFSSIAKKHPILFIIEDIHWIDNNSADFLSTLLHRLHSANITVICTSRDILSDYMQNLVQNALNDRLLDICPVNAFTEKETASFVNFYAPGQYKQAEIEQFHQYTGGNALFLVQLLESVSESGNIQNIPRSADSIIQLRLNSLSTEEMQILDIISIFPKWTPFDALTSLLIKSPLELLYLCDQLKQKNMLNEVTYNDSFGYSITHERIKDVLHQFQSESGRRILHLRVAQYIESKLENGACDSYSQLVHHFTLGGDVFKAFKYKILSLESYASICYELMPSLTNSSSAQGLQEDGLTGYFRSLERELSALYSMQFGSNEQELERLERKLLYVESRYYIHHGEYDLGLAVLDRLLASSLAAKEWSTLVGAHLQYIYYAVQTYNRPVMQEHLTTSMQYREHLIGSADWGNLLRLQGLFCLINGNYEECRNWMEKSIQYFEDLDAQKGGELHSIRIAGAYNYIAETYRLTCNYPLAIHYSDKAVHYNKQCGCYPGAAIIYTDYGVTAYQCGRRDLAKELFSYAEELYQSFHEYSQMPIALSYLAMFDAEEGDYVSAAARLNKAFSVCRQMKSPWWTGIALFNAWNIRILMEKQGISFPALSELWPTDKLEHCRLCLENLHRLEPRCETTIMEEIYKKLS